MVNGLAYTVSYGYMREVAKHKRRVRVHETIASRVLSNQNATKAQWYTLSRLPFVL